MTKVVLFFHDDRYESDYIGHLKRQHNLGDDVLVFPIEIGPAYLEHLRNGSPIIPQEIKDLIARDKIDEIVVIYEAHGANIKKGAKKEHISGKIRGDRIDPTLRERLGQEEKIINLNNLNRERQQGDALDALNDSYCFLTRNILNAIKKELDQLEASYKDIIIQSCNIVSWLCSLAAELLNSIMPNGNSRIVAMAGGNDKHPHFFSRLAQGANYLYERMSEISAYIEALFTTSTVKMEVAAFERTKEGIKVHRYQNTAKISYEDILDATKNEEIERHLTNIINILIRPNPSNDAIGDFLFSYREMLETFVKNLGFKLTINISEELDRNLLKLIKNGELISNADQQQPHDLTFPAELKRFISGETDVFSDKNDASLITTFQHYFDGDHMWGFLMENKAFCQLLKGNRDVTNELLGHSVPQLMKGEEINDKMISLGGVTDDVPAGTGEADFAESPSAAAVAGPRSGSPSSIGTPPSAGSEAPAAVPAGSPSAAAVAGPRSGSPSSIGSTPPSGGSSPGSSSGSEELMLGVMAAFDEEGNRGRSESVLSKLLKSVTGRKGSDDERQSRGPVTSEAPSRPEFDPGRRRHAVVVKSKETVKDALIRSDYQQSQRSMKACERDTAKLVRESQQTPIEGSNFPWEEKRFTPQAEKFNTETQLNYLYWLLILSQGELNQFNTSNQEGIRSFIDKYQLTMNPLAAAALKGLLRTKNELPKCVIENKIHYVSELHSLGYDDVAIALLEYNTKLSGDISKMRELGLDRLAISLYLLSQSKEEGIIKDIIESIRHEASTVFLLEQRKAANLIGASSRENLEAFRERKEEEIKRLKNVLSCINSENIDLLTQMITQDNQTNITHIPSPGQDGVEFSSRTLKEIVEQHLKHLNLPRSESPDGGDERYTPASAARPMGR
jgi:uncharacterized membrane protein